MRKLKIAVLLASTTPMAQICLLAILPDVQTAFPGASKAMVQMIVTLPTLVALVFGIFAAKLCDFITKKTLTITALLIMGIGGPLPLLFHGSIWWLLVSSALLGVGSGITMTTTSALVTEHFTGKERDSLLGWQSTAVSGGAAVLSLASTALVAVSWLYIYFVFAFYLICAVICMLWLPKGIIEKNLKTTGQVRFLNRNISKLIILRFTYCFAAYFFTNCFALMLKDTSMGDAVKASIGSLVYTIAGVPAGLIVYWYMSRVKRLSLAVCAALAIMGMLLLFAGKSYFAVLIGAFVSGFAYALYAPVNITRTVQQAQSGTVPMAIAAVNASGNLGLFLTAFAVVGMTGNLGISYKDIFGYAALFLIVPTIIAFPRIRRKINTSR